MLTKTGNIVICGESEKNPARFPCREPIISIDLGALCSETMETLEEKWRAQLGSLAERITAETRKQLSASEQRILRNMGRERAGIIPDTYWGIRTFCKAFLLQNGYASVCIFEYDKPILTAVIHGYGRSAAELIKTILYAWFTDMQLDVYITCRIPLEPGVGFQNQVNLQLTDCVLAAEFEDEICEFCVNYMLTHYEEIMPVLLKILQRDYIEYPGSDWISNYENGIQNLNDFLSLLYYCGWLEESQVHGHHYLRVRIMEPILQLGDRFMDGLFSMKDTAAWMRKLLKEKDYVRLRGILQSMSLEGAEKILPLSILLEGGAYRVYSWGYQHREQLYILAVDGEHRKEAYAIAIGNIGKMDKSEAYLNLRQRIRRLPTYKWVQSEQNLIELTLVLFTNE